MKCYESDADVTYLKPTDFTECFKYYMKNFLDEESINHLLRKKITIEEDGFFIDQDHKWKRIIIDSETNNELVGLQ